MGPRKQALGEKITNELNKPKIKDIDIEDVGFNDKVNGSDSESSGGENESESEELEKQHYVKVSKSRLRTNQVNLGPKYSGEQTSRSEIFSDDDVEQKEEEDDDDNKLTSDEDILADVTDSSEDGEVETDNDDDEDNESNSKHLEESVDEENEEKYKREQLSRILTKEKKLTTSRLSTSLKQDALKGYMILQQRGLFDKILDARIKFQKALTCSNSLPIDKQAYEKYKTSSSDSKLEKTRTQLEALIRKVELARAKLLAKDNIGDVNLVSELEHQPFVESHEILEKVLNPYRKKVLMKWSKRVQNASGATALNAGKFRTINQNVYTQLENALQDTDRLVRRTRVNRRQVEPLGYESYKKKKEDEASDDESDDSESDDEKEKYESNIDKSLQENPFIFDDDDFYRVLLNDFVDKKISDKEATSSAAIVTLSRNKVHKNYERMATKGRKMKYTIQEPLRNFEAPKTSSYAWNDDQIDQLFASLLGQKVNISESESENSDEDNLDEETSTLKSSSVKLFG